MNNLTHLSLFSGIGGLDLAAEWAGFETVGQCEFAEYPYKVLCKHWPDVPKWRDIRTLTGDDFYERTGLRTVDVISGGFPCQPFSVAGKRRGENDDRYLWPEMLRIIKDIRPVWVVGENVPNILNMGIEKCVSDLESIGYKGGVIVFPAVSVGCRFKGERVFIISSSDCERRRGVDKESKKEPERKYQEVLKSWTARQDNLQMDMEGFFTDTSRRIERNDDGLSEGVDRLKSIGNAVVPQHAYPIFKAIYDIETDL